jgi:hypothetical protein
LSGANPWWMLEFQLRPRKGAAWPAGCLFQ